MRLKIYQIDPDKDSLGLSYQPFKKADMVDPTIYRKVFDAWWLGAFWRGLEGLYAERLQGFLRGLLYNN